MQKNMDFFNELDRAEKEIWQGLVDYRENNHLSKKKKANERPRGTNRQSIRRVK